MEDGANEIEEVGPEGNKVVRFMPVAPHLTEDAMRSLHDRFDRAVASHQFEPLLLIPTYVLDFLCIHPFRDGNGRMARLLSLLLLYQAGFEVGRFISLENIVEEQERVITTRSILLFRNGTTANILFSPGGNTSLA